MLPAQVDPGAVVLFGVTLVGVSITTGVKLLVSLALVLAVLGVRWLLRRLARRTLGGDVADPRRFWTRQGIQVVTTVVLVLGLLSVWITPETDVSTGVGLVTAGLAFALQQVVLSLAAYFVILRGDTFGVGDRVTIGGVRGDVVRLGFLKTTIMEMGQPPAVSTADPAVWVGSRQYTGRLVTVTNGAIFDEPVYNYSRDFPYLWEEISLPLDVDADHGLVERLMLEAGRRHAVVDDAAAEASLRWMQSRYAMAEASLEPVVYLRLTPDAVVLTMRFLVPHRGVRDIKDRISREVLHGLRRAGIGPATTTYRLSGQVSTSAPDAAPPAPVDPPVDP